MFVDPFARGAPTRVCFITVYRLLALYINYRSSLIRTSLPSRGNGFPSSLKYDRADRCRIECGLAWMRVGQTPVITSIEIERRVSVKMPLAIGNTCLPPQRTVTRVLARQTRDSARIPEDNSIPVGDEIFEFPATLSAPEWSFGSYTFTGNEIPSKPKTVQRSRRREQRIEFPGETRAATYF